ncbi:hypothetical protein [Microbacterium gubbeenense]|uniref:hypothetical protein n=1 Tax=Microbacterium gubbeenense TaxID=159896 RepID=UPI0012F816AF|nr:hypothetical protein [Microbacterium gubbeenense]
MSPTKKTNDDAANARRKSENLRSPSEATESPRRATDAKKAASAAHDATVASRGATKKPSAAKKRTPATKAPPAKKRTPAKAAPASTEADQTPREAETAPAEAQVAYTPTGQAVPIEQRKHFRLPIDVVRILNAAVVEAAIKGDRITESQIVTQAVRTWGKRRGFDGTAPQQNLGAPK